MKSEKGITLTSLAIYITLVLIVLGILAVITAVFQSNIKEIYAEGTNNSEIDKFNLYFLKEVKKQGNRIDTISNNEVLFTMGNKYTFSSNDQCIYLNDNIKIAESIENCTFTDSLENGKTVISVTIKAVNGEEKTIQYVLNSENSYISSNSKLPIEYQQVEYIESTGTQYIDLGIIPTSNTKVEMLSYGTRQASNALFGSRNLSDSNTRMVLFQRLNDAGNHQRISPQFSSNLAENYELAYDGYIKITLDKTGCYADNNTLVNYTQQTITNNTYNLYLFTFNEGGTPDSRFFIGKLKYFKLWDNNTLLRNMIPCYRKADNIIGMYDSINDKFYTNQGTGEFIAGPTGEFIAVP